MRAPRTTQALLVALTVSLGASAARANSNGSQTGRAMRGCGAMNNCHGVNPGATTRIEGPATLAAGARGTYTLILTSTRADFSAGGFDIAVAGGTLMATAGQAGTRMLNGEMTHMAPVARSGAEVRVPFDVVAPASGSVMIFAAGNATNGGRNDANDAWAVAALPVSVSGGDGGVTPPPDAGSTQDAGARDGGPLIEQYDPTASLGYGGCAVGHARGGAWALVALAGLALARRRR